MLSEREVASNLLGHPVTALPDCYGAIHFADLIDDLRDWQEVNSALEAMESLVDAEIPGVSPQQTRRLVDLVNSSLLYCMAVNGDLDDGSIQYRELDHDASKK
jgi:hypothetical protein